MFGVAREIRAQRVNQDLKKRTLQMGIIQKDAFRRRAPMQNQSSSEMLHMVMNS